MWSRSMRAIARPYAASRCGAATERPLVVEDHEVARVDEDLDRLVRLEDVDAVRQHDPARIGEIEMDEALRAGDLGDRRPWRVTETAPAFGARQEKDGGAGSRSCSWPSAMPASSAGTGRFTPPSSRKLAPFLRSTMVLSGGSAKVCAVIRSFGLRNTSMVGPNCVTRPSRQRRRIAAEQQRLVRLGRRIDEDRAGSRRRCAAVRRAVPRAACSRDWRAARRAAPGRHS